MKKAILILMVFGSSQVFANDLADLQLRLKWAAERADSAGIHKKRAEEFDVYSERAASRCNDTNQQACNAAAEARQDSDLFQAKSDDDKAAAERIIREYGTGERHMSGF